MKTWHASYRKFPASASAPRSVEAIAARNRARRELCALLPLRLDYLTTSGRRVPADGGAL